MPRALTDQEWEQMKHLQRSGLPTKADTPADAPLDEEQSIPRQLWEGTKGVAEGFGKEVASVIAPTTELTKNDPWASYGGLRDWAASDDPAHPYSEPVGRFGADVIPSAFTPDLPILAGMNAMRMMQPVLRHPEAAKAIIGTVQRGWKGAVGDWEQGGSGVTGATTAAGLPIAAKGLAAASKVVPGAAVIADLLKLGRHVPYWALYHLPNALGGIAKTAAVNPGIEGASAERLRQWLGGVTQEPDNGPPQGQ